MRFKAIPAAALSTLVLLISPGKPLLAADGHVEDICFGPPGSGPTSGIYNLYSAAVKLKCDYGSATAQCVDAAMNGTFAKVHNCRSTVHFDAVYFMAAALGYTQDAAYFLAAFSLGIDVIQYNPLDSCSRPMPKRYSTPSLRGFFRTVFSWGGANMHQGIPFVGFANSPPPLVQELKGISLPLYQAAKQYNGGSATGCNPFFFQGTFADYVKQCPGLAPNSHDNFYEGPIASAKRWAMGETDVLCNGGFTEIGSDGSPFTGKKCPSAGRQYGVNIVPDLTMGLNPPSGPWIVLGEQVLDFECSPNCSVPNYGTKPGTEIHASQFEQYLKAQATKNGYAKMSDGSVVPELIARMGIFLHWIADRSSHWYCTDAPGSGSVVVKRNKASYDVYTYLDTAACNWQMHGETHYWEQGVNKMAPATYGALRSIYSMLSYFRSKHIDKHPSWFRKGATLMSMDELVGTYEKPGIVFKFVMIVDPKERVKAEIRALKQYGLPAMPGFTRMCAA